MTKNLWGGKAAPYYKPPSSLIPVA